MKIAVLGGLGMQGRAAVQDLARSEGVETVICVDNCEVHGVASDMGNVVVETIDVSSPDRLRNLLKDVDAAIDLLPRQFGRAACQAAIEAGTHIVNTNYAYDIADLDQPARSAGVAIMPECGLDPGIDLILYGLAREKFSELHVVNSYCGGLPEARAADNPLKYKVSWNWEGVLSSSKRDSRTIANGRVVDIPGALQHDPDHVRIIDFPELGALEAIPNGNAVFFTDLIGATPTIRETGRYALRWPGWSAFWHPLKKLGFLNETPVPGLPENVTPYQMMVHMLGPQLQYGDHEKDLVAMLNVFEGLAGGKAMRMTTTLLIERDLHTGLMAMSQGVGFPASIVAQMLARDEIAVRGVLTPTRHVPARAFIARLGERGIRVAVTEEGLP
ncbi:MAG: saccharopine dehydrogenase C-terminal domain-containing protein [Desulfobacterales bacterium]